MSKMKMKSTPVLLGFGALALGVMFAAGNGGGVKSLDKGTEYLLTIDATGPEGTDWQGIWDQLDEMGLKEVTIKGKGDKRVVTYKLTPQSIVKMIPGRPLYQLSRTNFVLRSVQPTGEYPGGGHTARTPN